MNRNMGEKRGFKSRLAGGWDISSPPLDKLSGLFSESDSSQIRNSNRQAPHRVCADYNCGVTNCSKLCTPPNSHFIMLMDFVNLDQTWWRWLVSAPQSLGPSLERLEDWGDDSTVGELESSKGSDTCLGWVIQQQGGLERLRVGLHCDLASSQHGGLPGIPASGLEAAD